MKTYLMLFVLLVAGSICYSQPTSFQPRGIGGGGALFFPTINPANDNEFYVACDMSEMFHSTDFGLSYSQIPFNKLTVSGASTYEFTSSTDTAYSLYNDGNNSLPVRTTDGGNSWQQLNGYDLNTYGSATKLSAHYSKPGEFIVGAYGDILFTNDGGNTFTLVKHAANMGAGITIGGVFWEGNNIYIGTNEGIYYSLNSGASFSLMTTSGIPAGEVIWSFAAAKESTNMRFVCITADVNDVYNGINPWDYVNFAKGVYVMDNASSIWNSSTTGISFVSNFIMYAGMAWNDIDTIYLGGNDAALGGPLVMRSTDGGQNWMKRFNTFNNSNIVTAWEGYQGDKSWGWSENCFGITVAPFNSSKVIFSTFSNVQTTNNGGLTWRQAYVDMNDQHNAGSPTPQKQEYHSIGLENTTCWQIHWQNEDTMIGCFSDIGCIRSDDAGTSWGFTYSGFSVNSLYRIETDVHGYLYGACSNIHDIHQSTRLTDNFLDANDANGKIVFSFDNGSNWTTLHTFNHPVFWLATDPNDANVMYASVIHCGTTVRQGGIYRTADLFNGASSLWTKLPDPPRTEGHPACIRVLNDRKVVCTFSGRRDSNGAFTASSGVFIYDPSSGQWTDVSDPGMHYWTKDIIIDPSDSSQNTWYVCVFSGWGGPPNGLGGLYKTTDRGQSWVKLTGSQFQSVTSITFNPQNNHEAYLTTEMQGLWISQDMNSTIPSWTLVQSYPFRQPERVFFNPYNLNEMWVSSFGNGMKVGLVPSTGVVEFVNTNSSKFYPTVSDHEFIFETDRPLSDLRIYDCTGKLVHSSQPKNNITIIDTENWNSGIYFARYADQSFKLIRQN